MNITKTISQVLNAERTTHPRDPRDEASLGVLYAEALTLGRPHLFHLRDGDHYCSIEFRTVSGISLEAKCSGVKTPQEAVAGAIAKALEIREQFK